MHTNIKHMHVCLEIFIHACASTIKYNYFKVFKTYMINDPKNEKTQICSSPENNAIKDTGFLVP